MRPPDPLRSPPSSRRRDQAGLRRLLSGLAADRAGRRAGAVLGPKHPLTRASDTVRSIAAQWLICASILTGAVIAEVRNRPWAPALLVSSAVVLLGLKAILAVFKQRVCDCAIELIAEGRETLPIAVVQRHRHRLLAQRRRRAQARALATMIQRATHPPKILTKGARPLFDVRVIASVAPDLRAVISLLQTEQAHARGVALVERLITDGRSPLYGHEAIVLREELQHVQDAL